MTVPQARRPTSVGLALYEGFRRSHGALVACVGLAVSVLGWLAPVPEGTVSNKAVAVLGVTTAILVLALLSSAVSGLVYAVEIANRPAHLPPVRFAKKTATGEVLCLLGSSDLFAHDALVAFYYADDSGEIEEMIGIGVVQTVREDASAQVLLTDPLGPHAATIERIGSGDASALRRVRVRPTVPKRLLGEFINGQD